MYLKNYFTSITNHGRFVIEENVLILKSVNDAIEIFSTVAFAFVR